MDKMPEKIDSKFRFVLLSAHRAEQMIRGSRPKLDGGQGKPSRIAMQEIVSDLITWEYGPAPVEAAAAAAAASAAAAAVQVEEVEAV